jgi:hypothetical protein
MSQRAFKGVDIESLGIQDPATRDAFLFMNENLHRAFDELEKRDEASQIKVTIDGNQDTLENAIRRGTMPIGSIIWLYKTWGEAMALRSLGWEPCDGNNGTPPLMAPRGAAASQRFIRSVKYGNDPFNSSGADPKIGGSSTATITIDDHTLDIDNHADHPNHTHDITDDSGPDDGSTVDVSSNEADTIAQAPNHTHTNNITSSNENITLDHDAHEMAIDGAGMVTGPWTIQHDGTFSVSTVPLHCECIPMMRVR